MWYCKTADQEYGKAKWGLGVMYARGHGSPKIYKEAAVWLRKAAELGNTEAQFVMGTIYAKLNSEIAN